MRAVYLISVQRRATYTQFCAVSIDYCSGGIIDHLALGGRFRCFENPALDEVSQISLGFPHTFLAADPVLDLVRSESRSRIDGRPSRDGT